MKYNVISKEAKINPVTGQEIPVETFTGPYTIVGHDIEKFYVVHSNNGNYCPEDVDGCTDIVPQLTLPTAKAGGFLLLPLLHWQTPYGTAMSYTVSTSYIYTVPVCPTVQFLSLCRLHLQSFFQNIDTCIRIPVMNRMAFGTLPDTNA